MDPASAQVSPAHSPVLTAGMLVRPAEASDHQTIANLLYFELHVHRHLDWRSPLAWLGAPEFWVAEQNGRAVAALACPQDPPGIAWVRLFAHVMQLDPLGAWDALWTVARKQMAPAAPLRVACIALETWFEDIVKQRGFGHLQDIVLLEWQAAKAPAFTLPAGMRLRPMLASDLPAVAEVDAAAFVPLWQNSLGILGDAYAQAAVATLVECETGVVGYQISTQSPYGIHLARLAVRPDMQGRGLGLALTADLLQRALNQDVPRVSVNTQSDNEASLALYRKLGFQRTGRQYPVYGFDISVP